jgi:hypothetical protein
MVIDLKKIFSKTVFKWVLGVAIPTVLGIVGMYAKDQVNEYIDNRIKIHQTQLEKQEEEEKRKNKPLRELLSETLKVPAEVVHYHIGLKFKEYDSLISKVNSFEKEYYEMLKNQALSRNKVRSFQDSVFFHRE